MANVGSYSRSSAYDKIGSGVSTVAVVKKSKNDKPYAYFTIVDKETHRKYTVRVYTKSYTPTSDLSRHKGELCYPVWIDTFKYVGKSDGRM